MGLTVFRQAEVQQPTTAATLSMPSSFSMRRAVMAVSEAVSAMTGSMCFPRTPPAALISSIASSSASTMGFSLMAMGPVIACSRPSLTIGACVCRCQSHAASRPADSSSAASSAGPERLRFGPIRAGEGPRDGMATTLRRRWAR